MNTKLLLYTKKTSALEPDGLARSIHFALVEDGVFSPLNLDYGVLFAKATIGADQVIIPKCLKDPRICNTGSEYVITACRTAENGEADPESKGQMLMWKTTDLCHFSEQVLVPADTAAAACQDDIVCGNLPENVIPGGWVNLNEETVQRLRLYWNPLTQVSLEVPESICAASREAAEEITVQAVYSDGSKDEKRVKWDLSAVDFEKPGRYPVKGQAVTPVFPFPVTVNYADPVVLPWKGKYYFISTNDGNGNIGFAVRESDTVEGLFCENVQHHVILDYDEEKEFIQTFWAPEFHVIGGALYLLFAVGPKKWGPQCYMMRLKDGGHITCAADWETPVRVVLPDGKPLTTEGITLDMTHFVAGGQDYLCWSYRYGIGTPKDTGSMLMIAKANPEKPWQLASDPVLLSRPLYGWENVSGTINNEGPYPLILGDRLWLSYSGGAANSFTYIIGFLTADIHDDLTDPAVWEKISAPALHYKSVAGQYGPGHNSFFTDFDGNLMLAFHGETDAASTIRCSTLRRVQIDKTGRPRLDLSAERDLDSALSHVKIWLVVPEK